MLCVKSKGDILNENSSNVVIKHLFDFIFTC